MRELYIYYRVRAGDASAALEQVRRLRQAVLNIAPGVSARLLRRTDGDGGQTWMETYADSAAGIDADLEARIEALAARLLTALDGKRHVEAFTACAW